MRSALIKIIGKVQGVWFRDFVRRTANKFELNGWTKNQPDGSVSVEVEGKKTIIENFIAEVKIGSKFSKVQKVNVEWQEFDKRFQSFQIIK